MKEFLAFIKLTRLLNVAILMILESIIYFGYIYYFTQHLQIAAVLAPSEAWAFILLSGLVAISGYVINDIEDIDIDSINKPNTRIVERVVSVSAAKSLYWTISVLAILGYIAWATVTGQWLVAGISLLVLVLLYFYSTWMKRKFLIGNAFISISAALPPVLIMTIESEALKNITYENQMIGFWCIGILGTYSFFAFATTFYREIVKDIQDIPGDKAVGCTTFPVLAGGFVARRAALAVGIIILIGILVWLAIQWSMNDWINRIAIVLGLALPCLITLFRLQRARTAPDFKKVSTAIKILMASGIAYLLVIRTIIPLI